MIETTHLSKRFGDRLAVDDVSFRVEEGEIVGFLGPNGAGKTTTMRMLTGFLPPTSGSVTIAGMDLAKRPLDVRRLIGYLPESMALYPEMRVYEYLLYRAAVEGVRRSQASAHLDEIVERCLLDEVREQIVGNLSKGYRQRVGLAATLIHKPRILILDEPTVGLDPKQIIKIRQLIKDLGKQQTVLLSTHILPEVELVCDRVVIIDRGRIVAQDSTAALRTRVRERSTLNLVLAGAPESAAGALAAIPGVLEIVSTPRDGESHYRVECERGSDLRAALHGAAVANGWTLLELYPERLSLEDIFVRLTTDDDSGETSGEETGVAAGVKPELENGKATEHEVVVEVPAPASKDETAGTRA